MADLNGIAPNIGELIIRNFTGAISRRHISRMRPHTVASNILENRAGNRESPGTFFEQNTSSCVVPALRVQRSAVRNRQMVQRNIARMIDKNRVACD